MYLDKVYLYCQEYFGTERLQFLAAGVLSAQAASKMAAKEFILKCRRPSVSSWAKGKSQT